ncbi:MAG: peptidylprolyl isomerase [Altererythrobacter sp.]|jgi:peptidylprolyl isomerase|uniref:Peptidyl-prolyl cis-trans isomerase n=1 Tax=Altererythrobacter rubellus TaxID=2173831 RepID=A0A9Y2F3A0_9SPHN|nr:peptidylprolyl isomerase [Altererythrobacter rubellus]NBS22678.1 peptidylprolyl isomerase [Altererythrobacter sp.]PWL26302.1 MAG: peptidylprolyl isomerase [Altererythrobacter sp. XM-24bin4]WIW96684.1 peptidylprolyl isomerase [Altererythrobacter rubellus]
MMKKILAASISAALLGLPAAAPAQDAETEAVEQAPASAVQYSINYDVTADPDNVWLLDLSNGERVAIRLMPGWAPNHVERVKTLTRTGFYDGVIFHRVIDGFMAQGGDPTGTGQGGSAMPDLEEEFNPRPHIRGTVSMARATDENSANSQFFIVFYPRFSLDKRYTNFGRVISNMDGVDTITRGEPPANPTRILQASIASDNKPQLFPQPEAPVEEEITADLLSAPLS